MPSFNLMRRIHVKISGKVQGVGFRYSIYAKALFHGIKGWVKNLDDGKVEAVFEGKDDKILKILEFCKKGPFLANVENFEVNEEEYKGEDKFKILR